MGVLTRARVRAWCVMVVWNRQCACARVCATQCVCESANASALAAAEAVENVRPLEAARRRRRCRAPAVRVRVRVCACERRRPRERKKPPLDRAGSALTVMQRLAHTPTPMLCGYCMQCAGKAHATSTEVVPQQCVICGGSNTRVARPHQLIHDPLGLLLLLPISSTIFLVFLRISFQQNTSKV
jgi:hypothetical protein